MMNIAFPASIACLATMAACSGASAQQGGTISFQGAILDETCTLAVPAASPALSMGATDPAAQRFTLALAGCATPGNAPPRRASIRLLSLPAAHQGHAGSAGTPTEVPFRVLSAAGRQALPVSGAVHQPSASVDLQAGAGHPDPLVASIAVALAAAAGQAETAVNVEITYP